MPSWAVSALPGAPTLATDQLPEYSAGLDVGLRTGPTGAGSESNGTAPSVSASDGYPDDAPLAVVGHFRSTQKVNGKWKHVHRFEWHDVVGESEAIDKGFQLTDHEDFASSNVIDPPELEQLKSFFEANGWTRDGGSPGRDVCSRAAHPGP